MFYVFIREVGWHRIINISAEQTQNLNRRDSMQIAFIVKTNFPATIYQTYQIFKYAHYLRFTFYNEVNINNNYP